jgi:hypothetical protein
MRFPYIVVIIVVTTVSAWITAFRMRRRMGRALGRKVSDSELTSIKTWMQVDEAERRDNPSSEPPLR